jgi:hypothetical protein
MWEKRKIGRERESCVRVSGAGVCVYTGEPVYASVCAHRGAAVSVYVCMETVEEEKFMNLVFVGGQTIDTEPCW